MSNARPLENYVIETGWHRLPADLSENSSSYQLFLLIIDMTGRLITRTQEEKKYGLGGSVLNSHCYWGWLDCSYTPPHQTHALCCIWTPEGAKKIERSTRVAWPRSSPCIFWSLSDGLLGWGRE